MTIEKYKNYYIYNGLTVPISELNSDCLNIKEMIANGAEVIDKTLDETKEAKIAILLENYKLAIKKDYYISSAILIDNLGQNIGVSDAIFSIKDPNILTHETAIVFAGAFKIQETFNQILVEEIKKLLPTLPDYATIKTKVYDSNKVFIPYTTTNKNKEEIKVKLSARNIDGIFSHLFDRVAKTSSLMGIKKQAIEDATTVEQLEVIDLTFPK